MKRPSDSTETGDAKRETKEGPVAWLRKEGASLKTADERIDALEQCVKMFNETLDEVHEAQKKDRVQPPNFQGAAHLLIGGARHYQKLVPEWMKPEVLEDTCPTLMRDGVEADFKVLKEPKGVCIVIAPWNAPVTLAWMPMLGMIAAGNRVVIKPAEITPNVSAMLRRVTHKYLHGLVRVEEGGRETAEALIDEGADHLVFTGSGEVGKIVMARCARTLTPVTLELGGKSPMFVDSGLSDAMLRDVVREILELKVYKTGQFCCAHDYAMVHCDIFDAFCERLRAAVEGLGDKRNVMLIASRHYHSVKGKLEEAVAAGASCLPPLGGAYKPDDEGMTLPFTALLETPASASVLTSEIFGPILPIVKVSNVQEAVEMVSGHPTGTPLIAYCYSSDAGTVEAFEAGTRSGQLAVNGGPQRLQSNYNVAFGGHGPSGTGVHMWGRRALMEFTHFRHVYKPKGGGFAKSFFSGPPTQAAP